MFPLRSATGYLRSPIYLFCSPTPALHIYGYSCRITRSILILLRPLPLRYHLTHHIRGTATPTLPRCGPHHLHDLPTTSLWRCSHYHVWWYLRWDDLFLYGYHRTRTFYTTYHTPTFHCYVTRDLPELLIRCCYLCCCLTHVTTRCSFPLRFLRLTVRFRCYGRDSLRLLLPLDDLRWLIHHTPTTYIYRRLPHTPLLPHLPHLACPHTTPLTVVPHVCAYYPAPHTHYHAVPVDTFLICCSRPALFTTFGLFSTPRYTPHRYRVRVLLPTLLFPVATPGFAVTIRLVIVDSGYRFVPHLLR